MSSRRIGSAPAAVLALVVLVAGCSSATATWPAFGAGGTDKAAAPSGIRTANPEATGARATAEAVTINNITVDYSYKNALITPIAHLYGTYLDDFVIVTVTNSNTGPVKVSVQSEILGYTDKSISQVTVDANGNQEVRQNPRLTAAAIDQLTSERPADLHLSVSYLDNGVEKTLLDQTEQTLVTSRRDFPWSIKGMDQQTDFNLVGAMVTPSDPAVEELIRYAAEYDPSHAMTSGYHTEGDSDNSVYQRLADIWAAETKNYHLTYISTTISFAPGQSQRIRLPAEVLSQASGNCIELVLLYAAAVEALGMQPVIIMIPGHAYLGVRVDSSSDTYYFVETTMIGAEDFDTAVKYALGEWKDAAPHVNAGEADYGWVSIAKDRQDGILPIPWH